METGDEDRVLNANFANYCVADLANEADQAVEIFGTDSYPASVEYHESSGTGIVGDGSVYDSGAPKSVFAQHVGVEIEFQGDNEVESSSDDDDLPLSSLRATNTSVASKAVSNKRQRHDIETTQVTNGVSNDKLGKESPMSTPSPAKRNNLPHAKRLKAHIFASVIVPVLESAGWIIRSRKTKDNTKTQWLFCPPGVIPPVQLSSFAAKGDYFVSFTQFKQYLESDRCINDEFAQWTLAFQNRCDVTMKEDTRSGYRKENYTASLEETAELVIRRAIDVVKPPITASATLPRRYVIREYPPELKSIARLDHQHEESSSTGGQKLSPGVVTTSEYPPENKSSARLEQQNETKIDGSDIVEATAKMPRCIADKRIFTKETIDKLRTKIIALAELEKMSAEVAATLKIRAVQDPDVDNTDIVTVVGQRWCTYVARVRIIRLVTMHIELHRVECLMRSPDTLKVELIVKIVDGQLGLDVGEGDGSNIGLWLYGAKNDVGATLGAARNFGGCVTALNGVSVRSRDELIDHFSDFCSVKSTNPVNVPISLYLPENTDLELLKRERIKQLVRLDGSEVQWSDSKVDDLCLSDNSRHDARESDLALNMSSNETKLSTLKKLPSVAVIPRKLLRQPSDLSIERSIPRKQPKISKKTSSSPRLSDNSGHDARESDLALNSDETKISTSKKLPTVAVIPRKLSRQPSDLSIERSMPQKQPKISRKTSESSHENGNTLLKPDALPRQVSKTYTNGSIPRKLSKISRKTSNNSQGSDKLLLKSDALSRQSSDLSADGSIPRKGQAISRKPSNGFQNCDNLLIKPDVFLRQSSESTVNELISRKRSEKLQPNSEKLDLSDLGTNGQPKAKEGLGAGQLKECVERKRAAPTSSISETTITKKLKAAKTSSKDGDCFISYDPTHEFLGFYCYTDDSGVRKCKILSVCPLLRRQKTNHKLRPGFVVTEVADMLGGLLSNRKKISSHDDLREFYEKARLGRRKIKVWFQNVGQGINENEKNENWTDSGLWKGASFKHGWAGGSSTKSASSSVQTIKPAAFSTSPMVNSNHLTSCLIRKQKQNGIKVRFADKIRTVKHFDPADAVVEPDDTSCFDEIELSKSESIDYDAELFKAIDHSTWTEIIELLGKGASTRSVDTKGRTAIMLACARCEQLKKDLHETNIAQFQIISPEERQRKNQQFRMMDLKLKALKIYHKAEKLIGWSKLEELVCIDVAKVRVSAVCDLNLSSDGKRRPCPNSIFISTRMEGDKPQPACPCLEYASNLAWSGNRLYTYRFELPYGLEKKALDINLFKGSDRDNILLGRGKLASEEMRNATSLWQKTLVKLEPGSDGNIIDGGTMVVELQKLSKLDEVKKELADLLIWIKQFQKEPEIQQKTLSLSIIAPNHGDISLLHAGIYVEDVSTVKSILDEGADMINENTIGTAYHLAQQFAARRRSIASRDVFETISLYYKPQLENGDSNVKATKPTVKQANLPSYDLSELYEGKVCKNFKPSRAFSHGCPYGSKCHFLHVYNRIMEPDALESLQNKSSDWKNSWNTLRQKYLHNCGIPLDRNCLQVKSESVSNPSPKQLYTASIKCPKRNVIFLAAGGKEGRCSEQGLFWYLSEDDAIISVVNIALSSFPVPSLTEELTNLKKHEIPNYSNIYMKYFGQCLRKTNWTVKQIGNNDVFTASLQSPADNCSYVGRLYGGILSANGDYHYTSDSHAKKAAFAALLFMLENRGILMETSESRKSKKAKFPKKSKKPRS